MEPCSNFFVCYITLNIRGFLHYYSLIDWIKFFCWVFLVLFVEELIHNWVEIVEWYSKRWERYSVSMESTGDASSASSSSRWLLGFIFIEKERVKRRVRLCDIFRVLRNGDVSDMAATVAGFSGISGFNRSVQCRRRVIMGLWRLSGGGGGGATAAAGAGDSVEGCRSLGVTGVASSSSSRMLWLVQRGLAGRDDALPDESMAVGNAETFINYRQLIMITAVWISSIRVLKMALVRVCVSVVDSLYKKLTLTSCFCFSLNVLNRRRQFH